MRQKSVDEPLRSRSIRRDWKQIKPIAVSAQAIPAKIIGTVRARYTLLCDRTNVISLSRTSAVDCQLKDVSEPDAEGRYVSYAVKREIVNRIEAIAAWRRERGEQDQFGFGSDVLARHQRSAKGLDELAEHIAAMDDGDGRLDQLAQYTFRGDFFDPGATLLTEIGRFRFHDLDTGLDAFFSEMIAYAETDAAESIELGGKQVVGDNPWRANFEIRVPDDPDDD